MARFPLRKKVGEYRVGERHTAFSTRAFSTLYQSAEFHISPGHFHKLALDHCRVRKDL